MKVYAKDVINAKRTLKRQFKNSLKPLKVKKPKQSKEEKIKKNKEWQAKNPEKRQKTVAKYHKTHMEKEKQYYIDNKEYIILRTSNYRIKNKEKINLKNKEKRKSKIEVKLHHTVSCLIRMYILQPKGRQSILNYLEYTFDILKQHIESLFSISENLDQNGKIWMNWNNWGIYNKKTWNDNNSSTWTWNIDHIIPQSYLLYDSMEHPNFKKCWALENLRPYSAKQNILDGARLKRKKE